MKFEPNLKPENKNLQGEITQQKAIIPDVGQIGGAGEAGGGGAGARARGNRACEENAWLSKEVRLRCPELSVLPSSCLHSRATLLTHGILQRQFERNRERFRLLCWDRR